MNILEVLKSDHERVAQTIAQLQSHDGSGDVEELFDQLQEMLEQHSLGEEALFYPVIEKNAIDVDLINEARAEHERVDQIFSEMDDLDVGSAEWREKLDDLEEMISAHVGMEETEIFAVARRVLGHDDLERIGNDMARREGIVSQNRPERERERPEAT